MFGTRALLVVGVLCISSSLSEAKVCDFNDSECLTYSAGLTFVDFVNGAQGVRKSDPIEVDLVDVTLPGVSYKLTGCVLSGFKQCKVTLVKINSKDSKYDYHVGCPHINLVSGYELKGQLGPDQVDGKGKLIVDFYDYNFLFSGDYTSKDKNGKTHIHLKNHKLDIEAKGHVHYNFENLFPDKAKNEEFHAKINKDWQSVDTPTRQPAMEKFMDVYIDNVNDYLEAVSVQDLFSYDG